MILFESSVSPSSAWSSVRFPGAYGLYKGTDRRTLYAVGRDRRLELPPPTLNRLEPDKGRRVVSALQDRAEKPRPTNVARRHSSASPQAIENTPGTQRESPI